MPNDTVSGPFVAVACICQTPLVEQGGQLSVIRITERLQVVGVNPQMQPQPIQNLFLVVILRSGDMRGSYPLKVTPVTPSGQSLQSTEASVLFEGEDRGPGFIQPLQFLATEDGLYWFEVRLSDALLTRIPLRVQYQRMQGLPFQPPFQPPKP